MNYLVMIIIFGVLASCGLPDDDEKKDQELANSKGVKLSLVGKTLYVEDSLYTNSCNQYFFDFVSTSAFTCKMAKASTALKMDENIKILGEDWTISFPDGTTSIVGFEEKDKEKVTIGDKTYFCLFHSGSVFTSSGDEKFAGSHVLFSSSLASKPSELNGQDVLLVANSSQSVCDALH